MSAQIDKRIIRTRKRLHTALLNLMQTKNIRDISVKELVEEAGINRSTFYLHYSSVSDILEELQDDYMRELDRISQKEYSCNPERDEDTGAFSFIYDLLIICFDNLDLCRAIFGPNGNLDYQRKVTNIIESTIAKRINQVLGHEYKVSHFLSTFYLHGCVTMLKEWAFQTTLKPSPEKMALLSYRMILTFVRYIELHPEIDQWLVDDSIPVMPFQH